MSKITTAPVVIKRCSRCSTEKDRGAFYSDRLKLDGLCSWCKECVKAAKRDAYRANPTHYKKQIKAWHSANREKINACRKARYALGSRETHRARAQAYRSRNAEARRKRAREYYHSRRYGITICEVEAMRAACGGVCAICRRPPIGGRGSALRGLLCHFCNMAAAIAYLKRHADG